MATIFEKKQAFPLEAAGLPDAANPRAEWQPRAPIPSRFGQGVLLGAAVLSAFWVGVWGAYLWGYLGRGLMALGLQQSALFGGAILLPPLLLLAMAWTLGRAHAMGRTAEALGEATERLFTADESSSRTAARLGRAVRHELDALNAGLDGAFTRLRALETSLEKQIAALDEAGARAQVRTDAIAARLTQEAQRLESVSDTLSDSAVRSGETVAGRAAQLKALIETAEGSLKMAAQSLDVQAAGFRAATNAAAEAPHAAAVELDIQAKKIEQVSDAALARAEFVLARQEKHRVAMGELVVRLKDDSALFEGALASQRTSMEAAIGALGGEARRFETVTGDAERHLELIMANAASRAGQLTTAFAREAERLKQTSESANAVLTHLVAALGDAGTGAQTLIGESAAQAKHDARALVGEAMAECEKLLRAAGEMSAESGHIRTTLAKLVEEVEQHLTRLPIMASGEAQRVRQMVQAEAEQMLDLSARTISVLHARGAQERGAMRAPALPMAAPVAESEGEGLKGLARKLTQRPRRDLRSERSEAADAGKAWEMKKLLAAVETHDAPTPLQPGNAAALGALQLALADMAVDLDAISADSAPGDEDWKRYLAGDRAVFARKLADALDDAAIQRITSFYRDDTRFHEAADAYLGEFEALLARAQGGDGGGLLTSSLLTADTGKIYLAIAYALGRL